ncbi:MULTISPECIES: hypothetical protein [Asticcacaulis]
MMVKLGKAALILGVAMGLGLSACGKQGELEKAPPLWGKEAKAEREAIKTAEAQGKKTEKSLPRASDKPAAADPYYSNNVKVQDAPLEGTGNSQRQ